MSDTPRRDAVVAKPLTDGCQPMLDELDELAGDLERENARLRGENDALREQLHQFAQAALKGSP